MTRPVLGTAGVSGPSGRFGPCGPPLVVPAYFHPAVRPGDWAVLASHPERIRLVVLNVASGPGYRLDPAFHPVLTDLRDAGIVVVGYVDTDYGYRPARELLPELGRYRRWYGVDGVFFDRVSTRAEDIGHYARLARAARMRGAGPVVFNHGACPVPAYAQHADLLGTFEGPWAAYVGLQVPRWTREETQSELFHLVHAVPPGMVRTALDLAERRGSRCVYATPRSGSNPWRRLCLWDTGLGSPTGPGNALSGNAGPGNAGPDGPGPDGVAQ